MKKDFLSHLPIAKHTAGWIAPSDEGELSLDIYETDEHIIIKAPLAGVAASDLSISLHHDLLTIRGARECADVPREAATLANECFWGKFSRSVLLPQHATGAKAQAEFKNGLLTIMLPKIQAMNTKIHINEVD